MKRDAESRLYPIVDKWLKKYHHCFKTDINTGLRISRIDVVGVRDIGGDLSGEIETICVEVKKGVTPFANACGQASSYKVYGNLVYLADKKSFTSDKIDVARHLGIGLIQISRGKCTEVLSSPYYKPDTRLNLLLLEALALGQCRVCGCFFETGTKNNRFSNLAREDMGKAIEKEKGLMFWNYVVGKRKRENYERRFICPDCIANIREWLGQIKKN